MARSNGMLKWSLKWSAWQKLMEHALEPTVVLSALYKPWRWSQLSNLSKAAAAVKQQNSLDSHCQKKA
jgi:hypothetical protein